MEKRKVSIIVPVYNVEKYVGECIESILGQTYSNLEILINDDGSSDGSYGVCQHYAGMDGRIRLYHEERSGVLVYEGEFANGLYEGMGSLYEDGALAYRGNFAAGLQEGDGTAYYPSGERAYTGSFAQGLYEGEGTAYRENGDVLYRGSFAQGLYDGSGVLCGGTEPRADGCVAAW